MTYIVVSNRPWNRELAARLSERTGEEFTLLTEPRELTFERLESLSPRYVFFPHWSHIVPENIFGSFECVIFHMTDVPFGRGGTPLQNLIARGFDETKMSALKCEEGLDAGPVYMKCGLDLGGSAQEIYERADGLIEDMIVEIVESEPEPIPQAGDPVRFERRRPEQSDLSEAEDVQSAYDHIRMLDAEGYPHAFLETPSLRLEFTGAQYSEDGLEARVRIREVPRGG